jgi:methylated-DNA-[protein]-cysteine S-methyltransferase
MTELTIAAPRGLTAPDIWAETACMSPLYRDHVETPIGRMTLLARDGVMLLLEFEDATNRIEREIRRRFGTTEIIAKADPFGLSERVRRYFAGEFVAIEGIETKGGGTPFEEQVWHELKTIPCGTTVSYGHIARTLGDVGLSRAVGTANGRNPIAIVVPCHRVIGADGSLTGYGGGLDRKKWLLEHEGALRPSDQGELF